MSYAFSKFRSVEPASIDQRRTVRHCVQLTPATVSHHESAPLDGLLEDLSAYGCRVIVDGQFEAGDSLWIRFADSAPVAASAVWYDKGKLGCRFDTQLDRALLRTLTLGLD
jgi:hypothetical protein